MLFPHNILPAMRAEITSKVILTMCFQMVWKQESLSSGCCYLKGKQDFSSHGTATMRLPGTWAAEFSFLDLWGWGERLCCSVCLAAEGIDGHSRKTSMSEAAQAPFFRRWNGNSGLFFSFHHLHSQKYQKELRDFTYSKLQSSFNLSTSSKNLIQCYLDLM